MIPIKSEKEIEIMREGGKILAGIMYQLKEKVEPGVTTQELNRLAQSLILKYGKCSFKGYKDFPACLCTSINEEIVHVAPSNRFLKEGDIISLDSGIFYKGFHTDMAVTLPVGKVKPELLRLIRVTRKAFKRALRNVRPGKTFGDIGNAIQRYVEGQGFNVIRELCGHGIGKNLHEEPQILNYGKRYKGAELKEGMTFCLEPMISMGDFKIKKTKDGHGYETVDSSLSAHFEHTVAVTKNGAEVLTSLK